MDARLTLLGPPRLTLDPPPDPPVQLGAKPLALLAVLAMEPGPHSRDELAALLWSDSSDAAARASLRQALRQIRAAVGDLLRADRDTVELDRAVECDARTFLCAAETSPEDAAAYPAERFLAGFAVRHAAGFEDWCDRARHRLSQAYRRALRAATQNAMAGSQWREATRWAERWILADPLSEEAVRCAGEAFCMVGDPGEAQAHLQRYRERVLAVTGEAPSREIQDLADRLRETRPVATLASPPPLTGLPTQDFAPSLVGRAREWKHLTTLWAETTTGRLRTVILQGESGIGKTRLAEDLLQWAAAKGGTTMRGQGYDPEAGLPYQPVAEALREALGAPGLPSVAPEWLGELARLLPDIRDRFPTAPSGSKPGDPDRRSRLFEAVAQAVLGLASERPVAWLIDDLQRADTETCALLHFLHRRLADAPVLMIATMTLGDAERSAPASRLCRAITSGTGEDTTVLALQPLTEPEVWHLIRELGHIQSPDGARRFARRVHEVTDGNPFHILELLKTLFAEGMLSTDPASGEWMATPAAGRAPYDQVKMPGTVHDAVASRCASLPYELRDLLVTVAVAGRPVSSRLLSHVHGTSRLRAAALADALVDRLLLAEDDGFYRCAHPIVQDVMRADLTPARRAEVHRAIALALEALGQEDPATRQPGEIARHASRGGELALAYRCALEAAAVAEENHAFEDALAWLDLAADSAGASSEAAEVSKRTSRILDRTGWSGPRSRRRPGTPAAGLSRQDLDLRPS